MDTRFLRRSLALSVAAFLLLSACTHSERVPDSDGDVLTWSIWNGYDKFLNLLNETYPDIELELTPYTGRNRTGYSWAQMRGDDIPDIFITSQILDKELAKERLLDLSGYDFVNSFSTRILDQMAIDGGIYLLPVNYAMYGIFYNKTLMEEYGWEVPRNFAELESLCAEIEAAGLIPGVIGTQLTGGSFSTVFNLAKTSWLTTPAGMDWERDFLAGNATAKGVWEETMDYVQRYIDMGMFYTDPEDRNDPQLLLDYLGNRKAVFCTVVTTVNITAFPDTGDELGMMPFISEDGSKNIYMYSPVSYLGISKRLLEPGNEKKLENAIRILSLIYSNEGQTTLISEETPCVMSVIDSGEIPEDSLIYDAQQAFWDGRAFGMTYAGWENNLVNIGQAYKEWFRKENDMDGAQCISRMDELQNSSLTQSDLLYFCESTTDFTLEETAKLIGKALGSAVGADAAMISVGEFHERYGELKSSVTGKLYAGKINDEIINTICPSNEGGYAIMSMTGAQAKQLAQEGFDADGNGNPYPYILVTRGDKELVDSEVYAVAFLNKGYTEKVSQKNLAEIHDGSLLDFLRIWLVEQKRVSPDGNPWE